MNEVDQFEKKVGEDANMVNGLFTEGYNEMMKIVVNYERHLLENIHGFDGKDLGNEQQTLFQEMKNIEGVESQMEKIRKETKSLREAAAKTELEQRAKKSAEVTALRAEEAQQSKANKAKSESEIALKSEQGTKTLEQQLSDLADLQREVMAARRRLSSGWSSILDSSQPSLGIKVGVVPGVPKNLGKDIKTQLMEKSDDDLTKYSRHVNLPHDKSSIRKLI